MSELDGKKLLDEGLASMKSGNSRAHKLESVRLTCASGGAGVVAGEELASSVCTAALKEVLQTTDGLELYHFLATSQLGVSRNVDDAKLVLRTVAGTAAQGGDKVAFDTNGDGAVDAGFHIPLGLAFDAGATAAYKGLVTRGLNPGETEANLKLVTEKCFKNQGYHELCDAAGAIFGTRLRNGEIASNDNGVREASIEEATTAAPPAMVVAQEPAPAKAVGIR